MFVLLAKGVKLVRIPLIILSVFGLGYNQGIMEYARNPEKQQLQFLEKIVKGCGCEDLSLVLVARDGESNVNAPFADTYAYANDAPGSEQLRKVASVGSRIVKTAKAYVDEKRQEVIEKHDPNGPNGKLESDEDYIKWTESLERMGGKNKWHFVLVESSVPNACVTELLPNTIFVTTSLLSTFTTNDDELGLVLGHEVAHLIHGHTSEKNDIEMMLKTMEVLLLSLDPTEGILSIAIVGAISFFHSLLSLSYSRHHELEADELGIKLAARACFNTKIASQTFQKMHDHSIEMQRELSGNVASDKRLAKDFLSTHPPSLERFENMKEASEIENPEKYADTHNCGKLRRNFFLSYRRWG